MDSLRQLPLRVMIIVRKVTTREIIIISLGFNEPADLIILPREEVVAGRVEVVVVVVMVVSLMVMEVAAGEEMALLVVVVVLAVVVVVCHCSPV